MLFRYLCLFMACAGGGYLIGYWLTESLLVEGLLVFGWCAAMAHLWTRYWPIGAPLHSRVVVEDQDLSNLTREARLPNGYIVVGVSTIANADTNVTLSVSIVVAHIPTRKMFVGQGVSYDAALDAVRTQVKKASL